MRRAVGWCIGARWWVIGGTVAAFVVSLAGFTKVPQQFFPSSDRLEVLVDLRLPEGGSFAATAASVAQVEDILRDQKGIRSWVAYTGVGTPRFFLAFSPELQTPNFAQFVINTDSVPAREALLSRLTKAVAAGDFADVRMRPSRLELGPPVGYPVQFRVTGPDPSVLRRIARTGRPGDARQSACRQRQRQLGQSRQVGADRHRPGQGPVAGAVEPGRCSDAADPAAGRYRHAIPGKSRSDPGGDACGRCRTAGPERPVERDDPWG